MTDDDVDPRHPLRAMIARLEALGDAETVDLRMLLRAFGEASFLPALTVPALLVVSPLSGIPLFSSICGISIALISIQIVLRRRHLWLPAFILDHRINGRRLQRALARLHRVADWLDGRTAERLHLFRHRPLSWLVPVACLICGLAMPFLELVPFSSSLLGTVVVFFSVSMLARDGLFVVLGLMVMGIASTIPLFVYGQIAGS